ncbi:hypothetical protein DPMN_138406 [Dreissena polymorpha]|uniref:Uncharacterized protein n=1 Tax=Dreissena polymorpha TaxID=45954 RepID=A0A9D4G3S6_DREPO|nr:hypothetical protein DPMN_138406 [Dreissena polymorpha]
MYKLLSGNEWKAQIQFLGHSVGPLFEPSLKQLQKQEPLIHLLWSEMSDLFVALLVIQHNNSERQHTNTIQNKVMYQVNSN